MSAASRPSGCSAARRGSRPSSASTACASRAATTTPPEPRAPAARGARGARPDLRQARPDPLDPARPDPARVRRRAGARCRTRSRRSTEAEVVTVMEEELGVPWEDVFASHRAGAARGRDDRPGAPRRARRRRARRGQGAAPERGGGRSCATSSLLELFAEKTGSRRRCAAGRHARPRSSTSPTRCAASSTSSSRPQNVERLRAALTAFPRLDAPRVYQRALDAAGCSCSRRSRACRVREIAARAGARARPPASCSSATTSRSSSRASSTPTRIPGTCSGPTSRSSSSTSAWSASSRRRCAASCCCCCSPSGRRTCRFLTEVVLIMAGPEAEDADAAGLEADLDAAAPAATGTPRSARSSSGR